MDYYGVPMSNWRTKNFTYYETNFSDGGFCVTSGFSRKLFADNKAEPFRAEFDAGGYLLGY